MIRDWAPVISIAIVGLAGYLLIRYLDPAGRRGRTAMPMAMRMTILLGLLMAVTVAPEIPGMIFGPRSDPGRAVGGGWVDPGGICPSFVPPSVTVAPLGPLASGAPLDDPAVVDRWYAAETAYIDAYNALYPAADGTGSFASFAEARATYARQGAILAQLDATARQTPFPDALRVDVMHLLQHVAEERSLIASLLAAEDESCGWDVNVLILEADQATDEARMQLGRRLGLDYPDAPATPAPTSG